jgi:vacuolar-type H+-ATPase subunit I/STV1
VSRKGPLTYAAQARKLAESTRFQFLKAQALLEEMSDVREQIENFTQAEDALAALTEISEALEPLSQLGIGLSIEQATRLAELTVELEQLLPDPELAEALNTALEEAQAVLEEMESQREDPSYADADEREYTRDQAREAFGILAEALDALTPIAPDVQ